MGHIYRNRRFLGVILICAGIGILFLIILPPWGWLALAAAGLIFVGWFLLRKY